MVPDRARSRPSQPCWPPADGASGATAPRQHGLRAGLMQTASLLGRLRRPCGKQCGYAPAAPHAALHASQSLPAAVSVSVRQRVSLASLSCKACLHPTPQLPASILSDCKRLTAFYHDHSIPALTAAPLPTPASLALQSKALQKGMHQQQILRGHRSKAGRNERGSNKAGVRSGLLANTTGGEEGWLAVLG